jgi:Cu-Zn family superoxide dismutase
MQAIAVFNDKKIKGTVRFIEQGKQVRIEIHLQGLTPNHKHGFHVHEYGDMTDHCESMCAHFNPYGQPHGGPDSKNRHVGDLGNLETDARGHVHTVLYDAVIQLRGAKRNIVGRGLVLHQDEDDLGEGGNEASRKTGNAGKRIACSVIGIARPP